MYRGANKEVLVHDVLVEYKKRSTGGGGDWYVHPPGVPRANKTSLRSRPKFFEHFDRITVAAAPSDSTSAPALHADNAAPASPGGTTQADLATPATVRVVDPAGPGKNRTVSVNASELILDACDKFGLED